MERVTNFAQFNRTLSLIKDTQSLANDLQTQIASGKKSQNYNGIAREAGRLVSLETSHVRVSQYIKNNERVELRLQTMESSVAELFDVMSGFKTLLVNALNHENAIELDLTNQATQMLEHTAALLNVRQDGRYLFSGGRTDTAPIDLTALPGVYVVPTLDGDSAAYYQGDTQQFTIRADDDFTLTYGVTGDELGFERSIRALDVVIKGAPTDTVMLNHALDIVNQVMDDLPDIRTQIGVDRATLDQTNLRLDEFLLYTEQTVSEIENVDLPEVVTRMNAAQTNLDAAFLTLARLSEVSLMNFLR